MSDLLKMIAGDLMGLSLEIDLSHLKIRDRKKYLNEFKKEINNCKQDYSVSSVFKDFKFKGHYYVQISKKQDA